MKELRNLRKGIYLSIEFTFRSLNSNGEEREMYLWDENVTVAVEDSTRNVINVILRALFTNYKENMIAKISVVTLFLIMWIGSIADVIK